MIYDPLTCVAIEGAVIIEGVRHRVASRFVACNPGLNGRAWNVTEEHEVCRTCYPDAQMELFGGEA